MSNEGKLQAVIEVNYLKSQKINTKVFVSNQEQFSDNQPIRSRKFEESIDRNFVTLKMEIKRYDRQFAHTVSGGNYDFYTQSPVGYLLYVTLEKNDKQLMARVIKILRENNFGCLPSDYSAHCSYADKNPTEEGGIELLKRVSKSIGSSLNAIGKAEFVDVQKRREEIRKEELESQTAIPAEKIAKLHHRRFESNYNPKRVRYGRNNGSRTKTIVAVCVVVAVAVGLLFTFQGGDEFFTNAPFTQVREGQALPNHIEITGCVLDSDGAGQVDVKCEGYKTINLWRDPPLNRANVDDVTLIKNNDDYQVQFQTPLGIDVKYDLKEKGITSKIPNAVDELKETIPALQTTIEKTAEKANEIKESIEKSIPKESTKLPSASLGKPEIKIAELEQKVHYLINQERQQRGMSTLVWDPTISEIARSHSKDMAKRNYFSHDSPEGIAPNQRGNVYGYYECGDRATIELARQYEELSKRYQASGSSDYAMYQQLQGMYYQLNAAQEKMFLGLAENIFQNNLYDRVWYTNGVPTSYEWNTMDDIAESTVDGWMNSPGHRQNILTPYFYSEGIGVAISSDDKVYITQNFC